MSIRNVGIDSKSNDDSISANGHAVALGPAQHLVWLGQSVAPDTPLYNLAVSYSIDGQIDPVRLERALDLLITCSDILQSQVQDLGGDVPLQSRDESIRSNCEHHAFDTRQALSEWMDRRCKIALDPTVRMFDCAHLTLADGSSTFYWCQHHISSDGFNIELIIKALSDIYSRLGNGESEESVRSTLDIPSYFDFVEAEREKATSDRGLRVADYWQIKSAHEHDVPDFYGKSFDQSHAKTRCAIDLNSDQREAIQSLMAEPGFRSLNRETSLFVVMSTIMLVTGLRIHGKSIVNLGFPSHARKSESALRSLGMFTGIGFLHVELAELDSFRSIARKVMREVVESFANIEPGMQSKASQAAYSNGINVLSLKVQHFAGMPVTVDWLYPGCSDSNAQLDLTITDFSASGDFSIAFDMANSVFGSREQAAYVGAFQRVLDTAMDDPDQDVSTFPMITEETRERLFSLGSGGAAAAVQFASVQDGFARQVKARPSAVAVRQDDRVLDFQSLDEQASAIAAWLRASGVGPGDVVGVCFKRSIDMYPAILGVLKASAVYLPLDPTYPDDRLSYMVSNSGANCVLCGGKASAEFDIGSAVRINVDTQAADIAENWKRFCSEGLALEAPAFESDSLYIMYTSGSTGLPKGVVGTQAATLNRFAWMWRKYPFQPGEVCCQKTALNFVDSIWELFGPLLQGVPTVVIPDDVVLDIFQFVDTLEMEQISRLVVVPSFLSVLLDSDPDVGNRLRTLENCVVSGEPLPRHVAAAFLNRLGHCKLVNLYGSTEVTADVTSDEVTRDKLAIRMPIGRPIDGVQMFLVDDQLNLMSEGAVGEMCIAGAGLSGGYFRQDELNAQKFIDNPFGSGRLFKTGDLGRFNSAGLLEHHGRRDAQIKIRGHRIESAEIENTMLDHEGVKAAVLLVGDNDQLFGFYVVGQDDRVDEIELSAHLQKRLPEYMIPALVKLQQVPLLGNGKINRAALKLLIPANAESVVEDSEPRTPTEVILVDLWKQTLGLTAVNIHADFFDLGGNSIAAMRIMVGARNAGIKLSLKNILDIGNIAELGSAIDSNPIQHLIRSSERAHLSAGKPGEAFVSDFDGVVTIEHLIEHCPGLGSMDDVSDTFHLTATQKGILFHLLLQGEQDPLYLAQIRCDLVGELNFPIFQEAWDLLAQRHDVLRSVILHEGLHEPVQVIARDRGIELIIHDLSSLEDEVQQESERDAIASVNLQEPISLNSSPMMRVTLVRMSETVVHLILDWHHILMDGWSLAVISNEVLLIYAALKKQEAHDLPEPGVFRDHVIALNEQDHEHIREFWRGKLDGLIYATPISQPAQTTDPLFARSNHNLMLGEDSTERLYEFARQCRVTPNTVIQAAWSLLLAKYNDTDDVLFGFAVTGRSSGIDNFESAVGMFVNSLPMRLRLDGSQTLAEWLRYVQNEQMEMVHYENSSLVDIQKASSLPANAPMFDSLLVFQNVPRLTVSTEFPVEIHNRTVHENSPMPITVEVFPGARLEIQVMYIEERFTEYTVEKLISHFTHIINSIASRPASALVSEIGIMSFEDIKAMTDSFNNTERSYPDVACLTELIWPHSELTPNARAITYEDTTLSYAELTARADSLSEHLISRGLKPNDLVGVCLARGIDLVVSLLAVMKCGSAYLPLDPDYPQERIDYILSDADVSLLITSSDVQSGGGGHGAELLLMDTDWSSMDAAPQDAPRLTATSTVSASDLAYVIYTSGSTGAPKGVKITRRSAINFLMSMAEKPGITPDDHLLAVTTVAFDIAVLELFLPLISGAAVDVASRDLTYDGNALAERIETSGITMMQATPTSWRLLLAADWQGSDGLKALVGGEALPSDLTRALLPRVASLWNMYGPTETTVWSTCGEMVADDAIMSIGRPIANTEILILDGNDNLCPVTIPGELCIGGDGLSNGYVNLDELTAEKFIPHPLDPMGGRKIYRTGDLARWMDDGRLECLGRIDNQVKLRGFRIELGEIESVLSDAIGIDHAVVKLIKEEQGDYLAAYLVPDTSDEHETPNELRLREILREKLPLYMTPATFMILDQIPKTPNGKIDRRALPDPHSAAANPAQMANIDVFELAENQPATETESQMSEIWEKILRREGISVNSNFFDLGGNSISAMQIMSACKQSDLKVSILDIFNLGTIRLLSELLQPGEKPDPIDETLGGTVIGNAGEQVLIAEPEDRFLHAGDDLAAIAKLLKGGD